MIDDPNPRDWRILQTSVCNLLKQIGYSAEVDRLISTPRGSVRVDVWALSNNGSESISYAIECKNWETKVPQTVIHSFSTVVSEIGCNVGYIITKKGVQSGAEQYLRNTNITAYTYLDFQKIYLNSWLSRYFCPLIMSAADSLIQYTEPINSTRERNKASLQQENIFAFNELYNRYHKFGMLLMTLDTSRSIEDLKKELYLVTNKVFSSIYYRDLAFELNDYITTVTYEFNNIFGRDIFVR